MNLHKLQEVVHRLGKGKSGLENIRMERVSTLSVSCYQENIAQLQNFVQEVDKENNNIKILLDKKNNELIAIKDNHEELILKFEDLQQHSSSLKQGIHQLASVLGIEERDCEKILEKTAKFCE